MVDKKVLDVLIVGAGFSGLYALRNLRKRGFNVKVFEEGSDLGGTWYWNCYPGARVDTEFPVYQIRQDDILTSFDWKERFPGYEALREYFRHVDNKLKLSQDIQFNTRVSSAKFCQSLSQWSVTTEGGESVCARHLLLCAGFSARRYIPPFKGLENWKNEIHHTSLWPKSGVDLNGKRVAVIGTGASGVQVIQEIAPVVSHLTVYQRTPNLALPMRQAPADAIDQWKVPKPEDYPSIFDSRLKTFGGFDFDFLPKDTTEDTPEQRRIVYEELYRKGGFGLWLEPYKDVLFNKEANSELYDFWCEKTRARINDPAKRDILAPLVAPHAFGTKRPSLEQDYYEKFNQSNVDIIDVRQSPILQVTEKGIISEKEGLTEIDVIVMATGFDCITGGLLDIHIENGKGESLQDKWRNGARTYLGMTTADFPNMFFFYGPQAPTAFCVGPTCSEIQGDWVTQLLVKMKDGNLTSINAITGAEEEWKKTVDNFWNASLFCETDSWYQGANIPGKPREALNYSGGVPSYIKAISDCADNNYAGFVLA